jgi:hypothetical protein
MPDFICLTTSILGERVCEHIASTRSRAKLRRRACSRCKVTISLPCIICLSATSLISSTKTNPPPPDPQNVFLTLFTTDHHRSGHPIHGDRRRRRSTVEVTGGDEVFRSRCVGAFPCLFPSTFLEQTGWDVERFSVL